MPQARIPSPSSATSPRTPTRTPACGSGSASRRRLRDGPTLTTRHCEEPLRRSNPESLHGCSLDCFAALAMTEQEFTAVAQTHAHRN
ncbi:hypothetical protein FXB38_09255 [Bradyrhizobium cytisi]|uniref:Uncharacterized protein n=1 Tax=Bradyrhizobium cytisi TaxID=515489 RepID=A0A5S4X8C1_9BRAD|nr:hypothetical protein FXB38_09255 [Bradyrhizobium cytisi]